MTLSPANEMMSAGGNGSVFLNVTIAYGDKAGDAIVIIIMFIVLLLLTAGGMLMAVLRNEIQDLYTVNVLNSDDVRHTTFTFP